MESVIPKFHQGQRVFLLDTIPPDLGAEQPEATVVLVGHPWYTVKLDEEFVGLRSTPYIDVHEDHMVAIEVRKI